MNRTRIAALVPLVGLICVAVADPNFIVPSTTVEHPGDLGHRAHTNHLIYVGPPQFYEGPPPLAQIPFADRMLANNGPAMLLAGVAGYHPDNIRGAYGYANPFGTTEGGGIIGIVDAYGYSQNVVSDFNTFSSNFGLPTESGSHTVLQVVGQNGGAVPATTNEGWSQEQALDIQWAHAMAPAAKILLVEANSTSYTDLFAAVDTARSLGASQISMSFGGGEFSTESSLDSHFTGVPTYFASSGDSGGSREYPAESPNVVGVGGTTLRVSGDSYSSETAWSSSGGGISAYEARPSYQSVISRIVGSHRGTPDIAADADPSTGVAVFAPYQGVSRWLVFGGTSVASPVCAGIANANGGLHGGSTQSEQGYVYSHTSGFHDITSGHAGRNRAATGWDAITGWGSPKSPSSL